MYVNLPQTKELMAFVEQDAVTGCWIWKGEFNGTYGYGCYKIDDRRVTAHRAMYMSIFGPLERKQFVCHKCDVAACVNPLHMFVGTQKENMQDCRRKNRHYKGAMVNCKRGHPLSGENLYITVHGRRSCKTCDRERQRRYWHEKPELRERKRVLRNELRRRKRLAAAADSVPIGNE